jgi:hypothetical protein
MKLRDEIASGIRSRLQCGQSITCEFCGELATLYSGSGVKWEPFRIKGFISDSQARGMCCGACYIGLPGQLHRDRSGAKTTLRTEQQTINFLLGTS